MTALFWKQEVELEPRNAVALTPLVQSTCVLFQRSHEYSLLKFEP